MFQTFRIPLEQRAVVLRHGVPIRALGPGKHRVWGSGLTLQKLGVNALLFEAAPAVRAVLPRDWWAEVSLGPRDRAALEQDGRPRRWLGPGVHRFWTVDPSVRLLRFSLDEAPAGLTEALLDLIPERELVRVIVAQHQKGLLYVQGRFERVLEPGRHLFWSDQEAPVSVHAVDMRRQLVNVTGQELMTRDKVTLRLSLLVEWAPLDPATHAHVTANAAEALYALVQIAVREHVAAVTLDELLEGREALATWLVGRVVPEAAAFGVRALRVGVKDVILPGEMKHLLNRVIEAEKQAAAGTILRREEAAQTRALANAAQLMEERPALLRLKELEAYEKIASRIQDLRVVVGSERLQSLALAPALKAGAEG